MNKKNIAIFTYDFFPFLGGQGRHIYEIYKRFKNNPNFNLFIFSPSKNHLKNHIMIFPETRKNPLKELLYSIKLNNSLNELIRKYNIDIAHFHGVLGGVFLLRKLKVPVVYTAHHTCIQQYKKIKKRRLKLVSRWLLSLLEKKSYKIADRIIAVSDFTRRAIVNGYKIDPKKIKVIPNGVDLKKFYKDETIKKIKNSLLFVGRLEKRKGIDFLVESMPLIIKENPKVKLFIAGRGKLLQKLKQFFKKNKILQNVDFLGFISDKDLVKWYNRAELVIVPSILEGFGITVIEAMACGTPVIGTNVEGIKGVIENNRNGVLVEYGNKKELASQIIRLLNSSQLRGKLAREGFKTVQEKYNWDNIVKDTICLYEKILS